MKSYCTYLTGSVVTGPDEIQGPIGDTAAILLSSPIVSGFITLHWAPNLIILFEPATLTICILQHDTNKGVSS